MNYISFYKYSTLYVDVDSKILLLAQLVDPSFESIFMRERDPLSMSNRQRDTLFMSV